MKVKGTELLTMPECLTTDGPSTQSSGVNDAKAQDTAERNVHHSSILQLPRPVSENMTQVARMASEK